MKKEICIQKLMKVYLKSTENIEFLPNIIMYGPKGIGKYTKP